MSLVNDALKMVSDQMEEAGGEARLDLFGHAPQPRRKTGVGSLFVLLAIGAVAGPAVALALNPPAWLSRLSLEPKRAEASAVVREVAPMEVPAAPAPKGTPLPAPMVAAPLTPAEEPVAETPKLSAGALPRAAEPVSAAVEPEQPREPAPVAPAAPVTPLAPVAAAVPAPVTEPVAAPGPPKPSVVSGREYVQSVEVGGSTLTVAGIVASRHTQVAIVNGATVQAGQKVGDVDVIAIDAARLTLSHDGTVFYLRMK